MVRLEWCIVTSAAPQSLWHHSSLPTQVCKPHNYSSSLSNLDLETQGPWAVATPAQQSATKGPRVSKSSRSHRSRCLTYLLSLLHLPTSKQSTGTVLSTSANRKPPLLPSLYSKHSLETTAVANALRGGTLLSTIVPIAHDSGM